MDSDWIKKIVPLAVFFVVANPATFKLTRSVAGGWIANSYGLPTTAGLLLHALVFVIVAHFLWRLVFGKKTSGYGGVVTIEKGGLLSGGKWDVTNARGIQGQQMHPADFDGMGAQ
jgi:hypothetical protein